MCGWVFCWCVCMYMCHVLTGVHDQKRALGHLELQMVMRQPSMVAGNWTRVPYKSSQGLWRPAFHSSPALHLRHDTNPVWNYLNEFTCLWLVSRTRVHVQQGAGICFVFFTSVLQPMLSREASYKAGTDSVYWSGKCRCILKSHTAEGQKMGKNETPWVYSQVPLLKKFFWNEESIFKFIPIKCQNL